jgi:uncharacterized protein (TIGR02444 family)
VTEEEPGAAFWSFSTALYARSGVAPACLALQDRFGADVNLLLFCVFAASYDRALEGAEFEALEAAIAPWRREVVEPLRAVRRRLKSDVRGGGLPERASNFHERLLALEIEGERIGQQLLLAQVPLASAPSGADPALARRNLAAYLAWRGIGSPAARQLASSIAAA